MKNEPFYITISKLGLTKDKELVGAKLKITDKDGKLTIDLDGKSLEWITTESAEKFHLAEGTYYLTCLLYTSPSPRDRTRSRMPSSA